MNNLQRYKVAENLYNTCCLNCTEFGACKEWSRNDREWKVKYKEMRYYLHEIESNHCTAFRKKEGGHG